MATWDKPDLRRALDQDQFMFHLQPKVDLRTERIVGFEALARWEHPTLGTISPQEFIPLIEETGLSDKFTATMLRKVLAAGREFVPESTDLSVNISPLQMVGTTLAALIAGTAEQEAFPLHRLVIEITESSLLDNIERALACAKSLKALGVRLALDDFGKGYSSLYHLQVLPFDEIKIDSSFVRAMLHERESRKIVAAMVGLGHSLGLVTIAEGIENRAEAAMLARMGCDGGQGWLYGRPVPPEKVPGIFSTRASAASFPLSYVQETAQICPNLEAQPVQRLAQLQAIYDGAPVGLCFVDSKLRFVSINERLAQFNGRSVAEHLGQPVADMIPEFFRQIEPHLQRALRGEAVHDLEVETPPMSANDSARTLLANYQPARDEVGEVLGVSVAVIDITSRKEAEHVLRDSEARLAALFHATLRDIDELKRKRRRLLARSHQMQTGRKGGVV
jgi:PAS domain S-box-containing protein